ncbi:MAG: hypothetical protein ABI304_03035 [Rudaea sp.]
MKSAPAIAFEYRPSRWVVLVIGVLTALAFVGLAVSGMPWWIKLAIGACSVAYATTSIVRFVRIPVINLSWYEAGHWRVFGLRDQELVAELQHAIVRAGWIVLTLRCSDAKCLRLLLTADVCDAETRRRLCVRLARTREDQPLDV